MIAYRTSEIRISLPLQYNTRDSCVVYAMVNFTRYREEMQLHNLETATRSDRKGQEILP